MTYFKRFRMEIDVARFEVPERPLPPEYSLLPWAPDLLEHHAQVKYLSFREEIDANIFTCFTQLDGCRKLMRDIARLPRFLAETTWLAAKRLPSGGLEYCGTIQGIVGRNGNGSIQNIAVTPSHRDKGIGRHLIRHCLDGFRLAGLSRVSLDVTAQNTSAIRLYEKLGFEITKTLYRVTEVSASLA